MIRINDVHSIKLIAAHAHVQFVPRLHHCIANYNSNDQLTGGVLYTDYWGRSCQMHVAGFCRNWATKALLYLAFDYPFRQLNVKKVFGLVPEDNEEARKLDLHLGFKIEAVIDDVFDRPEGMTAMYVLGMRREDCKWLNMRMPFLDIAPPDRTNALPSLAYMQPVGLVQ